MMTEADIQRIFAEAPQPVPTEADITAQIVAMTLTFPHLEASECVLEAQ
jgi:hypothetical protein